MKTAIQAGVVAVLFSGAAALSAVAWREFWAGASQHMDIRELHPGGPYA